MALNNDDMLNKCIQRKFVSPWSCMLMKIIVVEMGIFTNCFFFFFFSCSFHSLTNKLLAKYQKALRNEKWKWIYYSALLINYAAAAR